MVSQFFLVVPKLHYFILVVNFKRMETIILLTKTYLQVK